LNRLTDDQSSDRIPQEAEAIEALIGFATSDPNIWVSSGVVEAEIARNPNSERREDAQALLNFVKQTVKLDDAIINRGRELRSAGFSEYDAMHLACAESGQVDIFFTTDDRLVRRANREPGKLTVRVLNPLSFLQELKTAGARYD